MTFAAVFEKSELTSAQGLSLMNKNKRPFHLGWSKRPKNQQAQNIDKQFGIWRRLLRGGSNSPRFLCRSCKGITPSGSAVCINCAPTPLRWYIFFFISHHFYWGWLCQGMKRPPWLTGQFRFCSSSSSCTIKRGSLQRRRRSKSGFGIMLLMVVPKNLCKTGVGVPQKCLTIDAVEKMFHISYLDF